MTITVPQTFRLDEFLAGDQARWRYRAGEHVTILGPTGWGKTHLAYRLLQASARPSLPALSLVVKPRDSTVVEWNRRIGLRRVTTWPLPFNPFRAPTVGHTVWPRHSFDPVADDARMYWIFRRAVLDSYKRGNRIVFADEPVGLMDLDTPESPPGVRARREPNLEFYLRALWMRGRSMGTGLWVASQRPVDIPLHAYSMAEHLFLGNDPDRRARMRYDEIGGVEPGLVRDATARLPKWHWLYIRRTGQRYAIISP